MTAPVKKARGVAGDPSQDWEGEVEDDDEELYEEKDDLASDAMILVCISNYILKHYLNFDFSLHSIYFG